MVFGSCGILRYSRRTVDLRYPIGQFTWSGTSNTPEQRAAFINDIAAAPHDLRNSVTGLTDVQLDTPYRDGGWTVRQVVHHLTDAHINGYTRLRLALTEDEPTIKTFDEVRWAELPDAKTGAIAPSLDLLDGLHHRWTALLKSLSDEDVKRKLRWFCPLDLAHFDHLIWPTPVGL